MPRAVKTAPRKVLTAREMGDVDRATIEAGIPGLVLMESAASRVVEYVARRFAPLEEQRIVVVCGRGNNGGDGLAIARQIHVRYNPRVLRVVLACEPEDLKGDAARNLAMLHACGVQEYKDFGPEMRSATLVIDAVLGTGLKGAAEGTALDAIVQINSSFPFAKVVAVDIPSGLSGDSGMVHGEYVRACATVTFTAPKVCHAMPPACDLMGDLVIAGIGTPGTMYENNPDLQLALLTREYIAPLFAPRLADSNKGTFGHVLVVAGSRGKSGAAAMAGFAALRAGAGLVTVACPSSVLGGIAAYAPELMTEALPETASGTIARTAFEIIKELAAKRTLVAIGPGLGTGDEVREVVTRVFREIGRPVIVDADALNCLSETPWQNPDSVRVLTPHPGEMARLAGQGIPEIQKDRIAAVRAFATARNVIAVLKGERTLIGFPDGRVWINPTGSPAMATGGTGDILTGITAGLMAQFPGDCGHAVAGAVYVHGLAGEIAARQLTEQAVTATDLLRYLPDAMQATSHEPAHLPHPF